MHIIIEGWRFLPHSYSITNQFMMLEMLKYPHVKIWHQDIPFLEETWEATTGLFNPEDESILRNIPAPINPKVDTTFRITVPYNFAPTVSTKTCLFGTTEWGILHNEDLRVTGAKSLEEGHKNSDIIIITPSHWSKEGFIRSGAVADRTVVIPCGVDPNIFQPVSKAKKQALRQKLGWEGFIFLNVGGGTPNKGIDLLLKAFSIIVDQYPDAKLVLKGEDAVYWSNSLIEQYLNDLTWDELEKILPHLAYIGDTLSFTQMAELYQAADVYVTPYLAEGFNMPALEAIACGLPVICTKGGSTDDFIQPDFGWKIDSNFESGTSNEQPIFRLMPNLDHLINLMINSIEETSFLEQAQIAGPQFVKDNLTWQHIVNRLLDVLTPSEIITDELDQIILNLGQNKNLRINLGCGSKILPGYLNIDKFGQPDLRHDLETFPWPLDDNSVIEIQLIHVLEHLGKDTETYLKIIQEIYRICQKGAKIYIAVPHHRHDNFFHDPTHVRPITPLGLELFCQRLNQEWIEQGLPFSSLGLHLGVNFELLDTQYKPSKLWYDLHPEESIDQELFFRESSLYNNLIEEVRMILEVIK